MIKDDWLVAAIANPEPERIEREFDHGSKGTDSVWGNACAGLLIAIVFDAVMAAVAYGLVVQ